MWKLSGLKFTIDLMKVPMMGTVVVAGANSAWYLGATHIASFPERSDGAGVYQAINSLADRMDYKMYASGSNRLIKRYYHLGKFWKGRNIGW